MRNQVLVALGAWMMATGALFAQASLASQFSPPDQAPSQTTVANQPPPPSSAAPYAGPGPVSGSTMPPPLEYVPADAPPLRVIPVAEPFHVWIKAELLAWWVKNAPLPAPIAVVTDANGNSQTVVGNSSSDFGTFGGGRIALGVWLDEHNNYGFETSFFSLERRANNQAAFSDGNGNPALGLSYLSNTPGQPGEFIQYVSSPGAFSGNILVSSDLQLWGAEVNGAICLLRGGGFEFTALGGFRYADLRENLYIDSSSTNLNTGDFFTFNDQFSTRNQFYGGQVGARVNWQDRRLSIDATAKLALGDTHQTVNIQGNSSSDSSAFPGGFYAQPSNIGQYTGNSFSVIPSVELKLCYQLSPWWRIFIGYDFMYWSQVVRPGDQIDRNVNLTQSSVLGNGALTGSALPGALFNRTDFWAQGITLGLELRF